MAERGSEKVVAFILVVTRIGKEYDIVEEIRRKLGEMGIKAEPYLVYGEYDIVVKLETDSLRDVDRAVSTIRSLPGVERTVTLVGTAPP